uniref:Uncharacterized protein n=1 Tax=Rhodnius prolixus TaxID=13249 RepID=T1IEZ2_RHOPR
MSKKLDDGEIDLNNLLMSDEAHFELSGSVNKQNFRYWASGNPQFIPEKPLHGQRVTVWAGVASWGIIGPYFFDGTVNGERSCSKWAPSTDRQAKTLDSHALFVAALMVAKSRSSYLSFREKVVIHIAWDTLYTDMEELDSEVVLGEIWGYKVPF